MSHYTNPAFCQKSEFYPRMVPSVTYESNNHVEGKKNYFFHSAPKSKWTSQSIQESYYSKQLQRKLPPKPGPKPKSNMFHMNSESASGNYAMRFQNTKKPFHSSGYALVPLDEVPDLNKDRYAILPSSDAYMISNNSLRLSKSQDDLDFISTEFIQEEEDSFSSLPAFTSQDNRKLVSAFSTDFINKSMILVDQNSMQRYTIVPTDEDEEVVDSNHEILEMHNGRVHRYAVIPTDDEDFSTSLDNSSVLRTNNSQRFELLPRKNEHSTNGQNSRKDFNTNKQLLKQNSSLNLKKGSSTPCNNSMVPMPGTPTKNLIATQKLHELLSTPRKCKQDTLQRHGSYQTIIQKSPNQYQLEKLHPMQQRQSEFTPQKLRYENKKNVNQNVEHRTTAIISPRLHQQGAYNDTILCVEKHWPHESFQKVENATATIGIVSLMLILTGILNSGLCLYMVTDVCSVLYFKVERIHNQFTTIFYGFKIILVKKIILPRFWNHIGLRIYSPRNYGIQITTLLLATK